MLGFPRRHRLPAALRPRLDRDERIVAWSSTSDADAGATAGERAEPAFVVCTNRGVWLPRRSQRLGWHEIHKATWTGSTLTLVPAAEVGTGDGYAVTADQDPVAVALPEPGEVPYQVRTRVTRSVAYTEHHPVPSGGVRVVARRVPGVDGVTWQVRYDEGTDPSDPDVIRATADLVAAARAPVAGEAELAGGDGDLAGDAEQLASGDADPTGEAEELAGGAADLDGSEAQLASGAEELAGSQGEPTGGDGEAGRRR